MVFFLVLLGMVAVVALVKASNLRSEFNIHLQDYRDRINDLSGELHRLRQELARLRQPDVAAAATPPVEAAAPVALQQAAPPAEPLSAVVIPPPPTIAPLRVTIAPDPAPPVSVPPAAVVPPVQTPPAVRPAAPPPPAPHVVPPPAAEAAPRVAAQPQRPPRKSLADRLRTTLPLEELLGLNLFARIGIVLLVLGFAFLGQFAFTAMGPAARVALVYAAGVAMLGAGIRFERQDRYRLLARSGIGGGWAMLFFTTYAISHVAAMTVLASNTVDCLLMLIVAAGMVGHTLRYRSQVVTGLAFLLAFSTVALSQDSIYALSAGAVLALGIAALALRMGWFELEIFGIVASFGNHFYWLYKLYPDGMAGKSFPEFWPSVLILLLYWAIFRISYVVRTIKSPRDERSSTVAALVNTILLLVVMKFQSTHPELACYALLGLGALEFGFGQLPVTRKRRAAFTLLTIVGSLLIFGAVPFKFSGNSIALFWMIAAEALLAAGIVQNEVVFRRIGVVGGIVTGLLVGYEASGIIGYRMHSSEPRVQDGVLLVACAALFYLNALWVRRRWSLHFAGIDGHAATVQGYLGCVTALLGAWAIFASTWTALAWAVLMLALACGRRWLGDRQLMTQSAALGALALAAGLVQCFLIFFNFTEPVLAVRLLTMLGLAALYYATAWVLTGLSAPRQMGRDLVLWAGTLFLVLLIGMEVPTAWIAPAWMALAVVLSLVGRRLRLGALLWQEHLLAVAVVLALLCANLWLANPWERYLPFLLSAAAYYAISRRSTLPEAIHALPVAWVHTCGATGLLTALAWHESPQPWLAPLWALFALALALADRFFTVEELPWQAHLLALMAALQCVACNLFNGDKWHGADLRLITVAAVAALFYTLARWVRLPAAAREEGLVHTYTWTASALLAWMLWAELQPIAVALGLAIFGLLLFECGDWKAIRQIRWQGYVALAASFGRIFFVNLAAAAQPGEWLSPRIYSVAPLVLIYFYVWARLQRTAGEAGASARPLRDLIAYLGTATLAAIFYYESATEWVVVAWACLVLLLLVASWLLDKAVFLEQAVLLMVGTSLRGVGHNVFGGSYFSLGGWHGHLLVGLCAAAVLLAALPVAFQLRKRHADHAGLSRLGRLLKAGRPEQWLFFAPLALTALLLAVRMQPGMLTLAWGIEGLLAIVLGLAAGQRSYRLAGLTLLLVCVGKIVCLDAWRLGQRDRYITFIALGAALTLVSTLYGKFRETIQRLL